MDNVWIVLVKRRRSNKWYYLTSRTERGLAEGVAKDSKEYDLSMEQPNFDYKVMFKGDMIDDPPDAPLDFFF